MPECELSNLIAELEQAEAGSRELDARIWLNSGGAKECAFQPDGGIYEGKWFVDDHVPHYTTSIDAALTLVPEGASWRIEHEPLAERYNGVAEIAPDGDWQFPAEADGRSPALALCIAALKAREAGQ